ncbi:hypothetical protein [Rhabdochlamydiaceae symbiont of Dictyostelium giganteum]|uniref:hypothetical protein n=1 Tax=Rhabdochlamydiaceae symbiont of Dictyostelium giganteum TaxID=3342349 RepID=UPI00384D7C09
MTHWSAAPLSFDPFHQMERRVFEEEKQKFTYLSPLIPSSDKEHAIADLSQTYRGVMSSIQAASPLTKLSGSGFIGLTSLSYIGMGIASMVEAKECIRHYELLGDKESSLLSKIQLLQNGFLAAASFMLAPSRGISAVQDMIQTARHTVVSLSSSLSLATTVFSLAGSVLFSFYYLFKMVEEGKQLFQWIQGRKMREELIFSSNPELLIVAYLKEEVKNINLKEEDYQTLAIHQGNQWMKQNRALLQKKYEGKDPFLLFLDDNPHFIDQIVGKSPLKLTKEGNLLRLGEHLVLEHVREKCEKKWRIQLGDQAVDALKKKEIKNFQDLISVKVPLTLFLRVILPTVGLAVTLITACMTSGIGLAIVFIIWAAVGLISITLEDGKALQERLKSKEVSPYDPLFILFSGVLSAVSIGGLLALTILSGGALPCIGGLILTSGWLLLNVREVWLMKKRRENLEQKQEGVLRPSS